MTKEPIHEMAGDSTFKVSVKDFAYFCERCEHYLGVMGLTGWEVSLLHSDPGERVAARVEYSSLSRWATIRLSREMTWPITQQFLDHVALHECTHLLLEPLCALVDDLQSGRMVTTAHAEEVEETTVRRMESIMFGGPVHRVVTERQEAKKK